MSGAGTARSRRLALAAVLLVSGPVVGAEAPRHPVALEVTAAPEVSETDRRLLEHELVVRLTEPRCGIELVRPGRRAAELAIRVHLARWRERSRPGGEPVFDPQTGRQRRGKLWEVEVRYTYSIARKGDRRPLVERSRRAIAVAATTKNPLWDPHTRARRKAWDDIGEELSRATCKVLRKITRSERRRPRKPESD